MFWHFGLSTHAGLCQHHPRPRWHHGSIRLSVPNGHLHPCLYSQLHQVISAVETHWGVVSDPNLKNMLSNFLSHLKMYMFIYMIYVISHKAESCEIKRNFETYQYLELHDITNVATSCYKSYQECHKVT